MRATLAYTSARILLLVVSIILLYLVGARDCSCSRWPVW